MDLKKRLVCGTIHDSGHIEEVFILCELLWMGQQRRSFCCLTAKKSLRSKFLSWMLNEFTLKSPNWKFLYLRNTKTNP